MRVVFPLFFLIGSEGSKKMALKKVSILLILSIFGMTARAWCDPVKSIHGTAIQLTPMKMDENNAPMLKKTDSAKGSPEWLKKSQARLRDVNFSSPLEEKKRSQWMEWLGNLTDSGEFSENGWRNKFSNSLHAMETKSPGADSGQSTLKAYPDETGSSEQGQVFTKLKLLQSREDSFKEIFMGVSFSFDLTNGHVFLQMDVTSSTEKRAGFSIRF
jgi:hypothetical protein